MLYPIILRWLIFWALCRQDSCWRGVRDAAKGHRPESKLNRGWGPSLSSRVGCSTRWAQQACLQLRGRATALVSEGRWFDSPALLVRVSLGKILNLRMLLMRWLAPCMADTAISVWITVSCCGHKCLINEINLNAEGKFTEVVVILLLCFLSGFCSYKWATETTIKAFSSLRTLLLALLAFSIYHIVQLFMQYFAHSILWGNFLFWFCYCVCSVVQFSAFQASIFQLIQDFFHFSHQRSHCVIAGNAIFLVCIRYSVIATCKMWFYCSVRATSTACLSVLGEGRLLCCSSWGFFHHLFSPC